jgi:H+/Cl- antiporter ClcA
MTLFSYALSASKKRNFREPALLGKMIHRLIPAIKKIQAHEAGWLLHYGVGVFFASVYHVILKKQPHRNNRLYTGAALGAVTGLAGAAIWRVAFHLHPNPPRPAYRRFYGQLIVAHIIFGVVTCLLLQGKDGDKNTPAIRR